MSLLLSCSRYLIPVILMLVPGRVVGQQATPPLPPMIVDWLSAHDLPPDSASLVDSASGADGQVFILKPHDRQAPYWVVQHSPEGTRRLGTIPRYWEGLTLELVLPGEIYVRKLGPRAVLHRYSLRRDGSVEDEELPVPQPTAIRIVHDSVYAAWSFRRDTQMVAVVSLEDGGALSFRFRVPEPIEDIGWREDDIAFLTSERAIVRHDDGGWGGYERDHRPSDSPGIRLLHPDLPQFRITEDGLEELKLRDTLSIPLEYPDIEHLRRARPNHLGGVPDESITVDMDIGPVTDDGRRVWFGLTFYDGEGVSGIGGVGWLDPSTREAELSHPPEMVDFSVTAMTVHGGELLLGLATRSEGGTLGRGLARYDPTTGEFERVIDRGYINGIVAGGQRIFAVAAEGLLEIAPPDGLVRRWRIIPARSAGDPPHIVVERGPL